MCFDRAREAADALLARPAAARGILAGLPVPIKDLTEVAGVRTTYGSPIFRDHVPERSDILVERLEEEGALVYAKSNTPEFGAGASTFNEVFETTRNPWDVTKSAAGSSGGAWLGYGRLAAQSGQLLRCCRAASDAGAGRAITRHAAFR